MILFKIIMKKQNQKKDNNKKFKAINRYKIIKESIINKQKVFKIIKIVNQIIMPLLV